jgi:hypothetical protein
MPAKCGSSPREKVGMLRSTIESAPCRPSSSPRAISRSYIVLGRRSSASMAYFAWGPCRSWVPVKGGCPSAARSRGWW